jgi:hypothetical protein
MIHTWSSPSQVMTAVGIVLASKALTSAPPVIGLCAIWDLPRTMPPRPAVRQGLRPVRRRRLDRRGHWAWTVAQDLMACYQLPDVHQAPRQ